VKSVACGCAPARSGSGNGRRGTVAGVSENAPGTGGGAGAVPLPPLPPKSTTPGLRTRTSSRACVPEQRGRGRALAEWHGSDADGGALGWSEHRVGMRAEECFGQVQMLLVNCIGQWSILRSPCNTHFPITGLISRYKNWINQQMDLHMLPYGYGYMR
jgi:hypothetical protein